MKCPKCGSERIQFGTNTGGGGFSVFDSCCGYIFLGPLGLLCGACGSGTSTEEFWICQDCGNKFTNSEGKRLQAQEQQDKEAAYEKYVEYKKDVDKALEIYNSEDEIRKLLDEFENEKEEKAQEYKNALDQFVQSHKSNDERIEKLYSKSIKEYSNTYIGFLSICLLLGVFCCLYELSIIGLPLLCIGTLMILNAVFKPKNASKKLDEIFTNEDGEALSLYNSMKEAETKVDEWKKLIEKINYCHTYEHENTDAPQ